MFLLWQDSLAAANIQPGSRAPAQDYVSAIQQGCGVQPQVACHYKTSDLQEVNHAPFPGMAVAASCLSSALQHGGHSGGLLGAPSLACNYKTSYSQFNACCSS